MDDPPGRIPDDFAEIRQAIRARYSKVARGEDGGFGYPTGKAGLELLAYDPALLEGLPEAAVAAFCGVGNPFLLGTLEAGERVLDVGCGAGLDLAVAARLVSPGGRVCGIDMTAEMVEMARRNLAAGPDGIEIRHASSEEIPYPDGAFDCVLSNGVLNLSPDKERTFREIFRVLAPGGRLQFSDIVLRADLPPEMIRNYDAWSQ